MASNSPEPRLPYELLPEGDGPELVGAAGKLGKGALGLALVGILASVYAVEGGYANHPDDPGGATRYGITERVARSAGYRGDMRHFPKRCDGPARACADAIYLKDYIVAPGYLAVIEIEPAVGSELVDTGVNMGPRRPSRWFQEGLATLGSPRVRVDGSLGPSDIAAYRVLQRNRGAAPACVAMLDLLDARQEREYRRIASAKPRSRVFLKGWLRTRIGNVDRGSCGKVT